MRNRSFSFNSEHVAERKVRDEYVLIPVSSAFGQSGTLYDLNAMAATIWDLAKTGTSEKEICTLLQAEYEVEPADLAEDVQTILNELITFGALIEKAEEA